MSRPYDATVKTLIEKYPADWLPLSGLRTSAAIDAIDADVSSVSAAADKVLAVRDSPPWLLHLELQSSHETDLAERLHWYNALLGHRHRQRVRSVLVLLRQAADSPGLTGLFEQQFPGELPYDQFRYSVVRLWHLPVERLLTGGLGTLPLAPISGVTEADLPDVVQQMDCRLQQEANSDEAAVLGTAAFILTGLRLLPAAIMELYRGVHFMSILKDSSAYQVFLEEGKTVEARAILRRQGQIRFGAPDAATVAALEGITDLARLERMSERILNAGSWQEVLATI
ncbi:hypothetical protein AYO44_08465 [Planctomycetaceae bacterium SCGC AG-212-F19]|nr:hypothetical protein AYO44_08465 [Planctomycetaceae bacterium SCGC AG-212-F19]